MIFKSFYNNLKAVKIITAHHVTDNEPIIDSCIISKEGFLEYVSGKNFVPLSKALKSISKNNKAYVLTVDDALDNLYTEIYPICKAQGIPFTAFISADLIDKEGYITTAQLIEMAQDPIVTIGSHGCTHIKLKDLTKEQAYYEIYKSKDKLERLINKRIDHISYPNGAVNKRVLRLTKKAGYKYGFGVRPRKCNLLSLVFNRFLLPRYNLTNDTLHILGE